MPNVEEHVRFCVETFGEDNRELCYMVNSWMDAPSRRRGSRHRVERHRVTTPIEACMIYGNKDLSPSSKNLLIARMVLQHLRLDGLVTPSQEYAWTWEGTISLMKETAAKDEVRKVIFIPLAVCMFVFTAFFYYRFYMENYFNPVIYAIGTGTIGGIFLIATSGRSQLPRRGKIAVVVTSFLIFIALTSLFIAQSQATYRIVVESNTEWSALISWNPAYVQKNIFTEKSLPAQLWETGNKNFEINSARSVSVLFNKCTESGFVRVKIYRNDVLIEQQEIPSEFDRYYHVYIWVTLPFPFGGDPWGSTHSHSSSSS